MTKTYIETGATFQTADGTVYQNYLGRLINLDSPKGTTVQVASVDDAVLLTANQTQVLQRLRMAPGMKLITTDQLGRIALSAGAIYANQLQALIDAGLVAGSTEMRSSIRLGKVRSVA